MEHFKGFTMMCEMSTHDTGGFQEVSVNTEELKKPAQIIPHS